MVNAVCAPVRSAESQSGESLLVGDLVGVGERFRDPTGPERYVVLGFERSTRGNTWAFVRNVATRAETRIPTRELRRIQCAEDGCNRSDPGVY